jgi:hypothetical protein
MRAALAETVQEHAETLYRSRAGGTSRPVADLSEVDVAEPDLEELAGRLAVAGLTEQAAELLETRKELAYLDRPPGPLARITRHVRRAAARQWKLATAELPGCAPCPAGW